MAHTHSPLPFPLSLPFAYLGSLIWMVNQGAMLYSQPSSCLCPTQGVYERCEVLLRSPFDACHAYVSPLPFTASCTSDLCQ